MFFKKEGFQNKSLNKVNVAKKKSLSFKNVFRVFLICFLFGSVIYFWNSISYAVGSYVKGIAWKIVKVVAEVSSKQPKKDSLWNVNILLLGVWGKNHDGGYLTDTIIIASFNPKLKTLTFLSIPRDLYVKYDKYRWGRINYIFADEYLKTKSFNKAAEKLEKKIQEITGIKVNYYVLVDFYGFEKFIDSLWGITINVPYTLVDNKYPGPNRTYVTFKITKGIHHLDWATALKYARSRHSTSDFSRSARQEQIIKAVIKKLLSSDFLLSPTKIKTLYLKVQDIFKTDMDFETMLSFVPYVKELKIHSYILNWSCFYKQVNRRNLAPGCFVYPAPRDVFNWQAVLLPVGATYSNVAVYDKIKKFVFIALRYPELWLENAKIQILNWINSKRIKSKYGYLKPVASKLAYELKNYWFNVQDVWNATKYFDETTDFVYNQKPVTQQLLSIFVWNIQFQTGDIKYAGSGYDMTLILWNNYLDSK